MNEVVQRWHCVLAGKEHGPFDTGQLQALIAEGRAGDQTLVWSEGMAGWVPLADTELKALLKSKPPAPPPLQAPPALAAIKPAALQQQPASPAQAQNEAIALGSVESITLPKAAPGSTFPIEQLRDPNENFWLKFIWAANIIILGIPAFLLLTNPRLVGALLLFSLYGGFFWLITWISWKLLLTRIHGNSIEVTKDQYPQIYNVIARASDFLQIERPTVFVLQGDGLFEMLLAKRFTRRGVIIITSAMVDEFAAKPTSREFMMFVGRQLGHIKAGHFHYWFLKDVIGRAAIFFHGAWKRSCHYTADRIGLLAAGDLYSAEQALLMITAGTKIAPGTDFNEIVEQRRRLYDSVWAYIALLFSSYPYMLDRIIRLREFALNIGMKAPAAGAFPIEHSPLRAVPILIIHGHDQVALLELKDLLHSKFPNVALKVMLTDNLGTMSMPEKFEKVAGDIRGAIALVTPDDVGSAVNRQDAATARARQNVIMEIGFVWGRLGRDKCMLMTRGDLELPSDLSGIDFQKFDKSPRECVFEVHTFLNHVTGD